MKSTPWLLANIRVSILTILCILGSARLTAAETALLSRRGKAMLPITVSPKSTLEIHSLAATLAAYLSRMGGADFSVVTNESSTGILLGVASNYPAIAKGLEFKPEDPLRREEYLLKSHKKTVYLIGATDIAVRHAVWDFLYRLGYRQFFPGETWEVVPPPSDLSITADTVEKPDFVTRAIWYGHGYWKYNEQPHKEWSERNRAVRGFDYQSSHMYQSVIRRNKEVFEKHPEYLALVDGVRKGAKFCISNPALREFVVDYVRRQLLNNPADCVSAEPSDGAGWCECAACAAIGSVSDQALTLANDIARMVAKEFPGTQVGLLAYSMHSPPPTLRAEPNVIVKVQTAFIRGGYTFDELARGWSERADLLGVGDYYGVFLWDHSRPARQKASHLAYIAESIPRFHRLGARVFTCESSDQWGPNGLGHYLAARLMWDTREADRYRELIDDFLERAFGPARPPMERFYRLINLFEPDDRRPLIRSDMVARMYRSIDEARRLADGAPDILARIDDLLLMTRYEDLHQRHELAEGTAQKQQALTNLLQHTWRMRETMMVHAKPALMRLAPKEKDEQRADLKPFMSDKPFDEAEKRAILADGISTYEPIDVDFEPISYSDELVPATALQLTEVPTGQFNKGAPKGTQIFYTWLEENDPTPLELRVSGGHIVHYREIASPVQVSLFADANPILTEPVAFDDSVPPDGTEHTLRLKSAFAGLHKIKVVPPSNRAKVEQVGAKAMTLPSSLDLYNDLTGLWTLYFYVPRGTKTVGGYASGSTRGFLVDSSGNKLVDFSKLERDTFFSATVAPGEDGVLWKFDSCSGRRALLTVPPYLARDAASLLLPKEVVERDTANP